MVDIKAVRASNAQIKSTFPNPTAVFVGATAGIGQSALEQLAKNTDKPTIYLVGRSVKAGNEIVENLKKLNAGGTYTFIQADVALLANVDKVCAQIKAKEQKVDFIVLSCGYLDFGSRKDTTEGLDALLSLRYYARLRVIERLLPLHPTRVVSVLAGTTEGTLIEDDLDLAKPGNYTFLTCAAHSSSMTSLSFEHLAKQHPEMSLVHEFPGMVKTKAVTSGFHPWVAFVFDWFILPLFTPFFTTIEDAGARALFYLTSARYPPKNGFDGVPKPDGVSTAKGDGAYLVGSTGETGQGKPMIGYRERGYAETVWAHAMKTFQDVEAKSK